MLPSIFHVFLIPFMLSLDTSPIAKVDSGDASDDECMILDGDPDKPVAVVHDKEHEADELLIVAEKGDIACRDYPHARHLCATFPFRLTPHNQHCNQCHCYVCDVVAPCAYWGNGTSTADHCHSTDKENWQMLRKFLKDGIASIANGKNLGNSDPIVAAAPQSPIASTATSGYNSMLPAQRPVTDHSSTTFAPSSILHPHVSVVLRHSAEILGCFDARVAPTPHGAYNPSYPSVGYNLSGSNLWSSSPAMTNLSSSGLDVITAGNQPQNFEYHFFMGLETPDDGTIPLFR